MCDPEAKPLVETVEPPKQDHGNFAARLSALKDQVAQMSESMNSFRRAVNSRAHQFSVDVRLELKKKHERDAKRKAQKAARKRNRKR